MNSFTAFGRAYSDFCFMWWLCKHGSRIKRIIIISYVTVCIFKFCWLSHFSCCREGFEQERLEALLHKIELGQKHQTNNFGFHLAIVSEGVTEWEGEWVGLLEG